ncbi:putative leucine-rich repeat-containing protein DDB_G0290503 [Eupeodes corollae]|uniref:putative leucine-rich repeat-containing protein DDB_G0290503 n=1 Tax=Eupeodes corollae TaxID=290404 RepID=UPI002492BB83|nr:putative leucine-rich repeat-containing protein DDB_G0290503 [Eupeodes corollae]
MNISKTEAENNDVKTKSKIPPMPKTTSSRFSGCNLDSARSKIPKRDACTAKDSAVKSFRMKPMKPSSASRSGENKSSASMMELNLHKTITHLAPSRSCFNSSRSDKGKEQTPRPENSIKIKTERALSKRNLQSYELAKEKLKSCQEQFMNKHNLVKDQLPKDERDLKLICLFKNIEDSLVTKNQTSTIITMSDEQTLEEFKSSLKNFVQKKLEAIDNIDLLSKSPREVGDTALKDDELFKQIQDTKRNYQIEKKTLLNDFLAEIESLQVANDKTMKSNNTNNEFEAKFKQLLDQFNELQTRLKESQAEVTKIKKISEQKLSTFKKELEERHKIESKIKLEIDELKKKNECLEKEHHKANKEVSEKLNKKSHDCEDLTQKLKVRADNNVKLEVKNKEIEAKNKELELTIEKLKLELIVAKNSDNEKARDLSLKYTDEINTFKTDLLNVQKEKEFFENEVQSLKNEIVKFKKFQSKVSDLQVEINQANIEKLDLNERIRNLEGKLEESESQASVSREVQEEMEQLQRINNMNNEKIKNLENAITKSQFQVKNLEEKISLDKKLLKVRTDLIDSLQSKEKSQKVRLKDLFVEVGEKNNNLQMIKTEILTKTEEFQNLFSTLSTNQMELTRQEHVIRLLQENNERAQHLRVRQEAKIAKLEEEILELKQTISIYQDAVLPNSNLRWNLAAAETYRGDCNDSLGFYVEERRKKRHIDISVKKYEK